MNAGESLIDTVILPQVWYDFVKIFKKKGDLDAAVALMFKSLVISDSKKIEANGLLQDALRREKEERNNLPAST